MHKGVSLPHPKSRQFALEGPCVANHNLGNLITAPILSSKQAAELNLREMLPVSSQSHFILLQHCWQSERECLENLLF